VGDQARTKARFRLPGVRDGEVRFVVEDSSGKQHPGASRLSTGREIKSSILLPLPMDKIRTVHFQWRPIRRFEFRNVSLFAGERTAAVVDSVPPANEAGPIRDRVVRRAADENLPVGRASSLPSPADSQAGSSRHGTKPDDGEPDAKSGRQAANEANELSGDPADPPPVSEDPRTVVATIFGEQIFADDPRAKRLFSEIAMRAKREYTRKKKLRPTPEELTKIFSDTVAQHPELLEGDDETKRKTAMRLFWLRASSLDWIVAKALYEEYGGSIAVSFFGAYESITGRNAIIRQFVTSGDIQIHQPKAEREFWERFQSKRVLDVTVTDPKRIERHFAVSPWQGWIQELDQRTEEPNPAISPTNETSEVEDNHE